MTPRRDRQLLEALEALPIDPGQLNLFEGLCTHCALWTTTRQTEVKGGRLEEHCHSCEPDPLRPSWAPQEPCKASAELSGLHVCCDRPKGHGGPHDCYHTERAWRDRESG